jgi:hypothetical protein
MQRWSSRKSPWLLLVSLCVRVCVVSVCVRALCTLACAALLSLGGQQSTLAKQFFRHLEWRLMTAHLWDVNERPCFIPELYLKSLTITTGFRPSCGQLWAVRLAVYYNQPYVVCFQPLATKTVNSRQLFFTFFFHPIFLYEYFIMSGKMFLFFNFLI